MLKFLSKVKIDFNASDPRVASCMEFLAQCNARKARESNPACQLVVNRRLDDLPPKIKLTFVNGAEKVIDAAATPAKTIKELIRNKSQLFEAQKIFREEGKQWPVKIPAGELEQPVPEVPESLKTLAQNVRNKTRGSSGGAELRVRLTSFEPFTGARLDSFEKNTEPSRKRNC